MSSIPDTQSMSIGSEWVWCPVRASVKLMPLSSIMVWSGRSSADRDVCLHALAATLANVDRRAEAKGVFQRLERRGSLCTPIENGRLRLNATGGTQSCPRHADRLDSHHAGYARGVGLLSRSRFSRQQENGHPDRKHPDRHLAVEAGEHGIVRTAPTLEARDRLRG